MNLLDILLGITVIYCAFRAVTLESSFDAVLFFIVFGITLSFVWIRVGAYDVAIAEAAIGSGISGALLLDTLYRLKRGRSSEV